MGIASILRLAGYEDDAIEYSLAQMEKQHTNDTNENRNSPTHDVFSLSHVSQTLYLSSQQNLIHLTGLKKIKELGSVD